MLSTDMDKIYLHDYAGPKELFRRTYVIKGMEARNTNQISKLAW